MSNKKIIIKGARANNLKNINDVSKSKTAYGSDRKEPVYAQYCSKRIRSVAL